MSILKLNLRQSALSSWCYILGAISYPVTAVLILTLGLPTSATNIALKSLYLGFYLLVILSLVLKRSVRVPPSFIFFLSFFGLYSCRLVWDVSFRGIPFSSGGAFYVYAYYFGATLIPCVALFCSYRYINPESFFWKSYWVLVVANILLLYYLLTSGTQSYVEMMAGRANVQSDNEMGTESTFINPIMIGQMGAVMVIHTVNLLLKGIRKRYALFYIGAGAIGFANVLLGASRGPLLFMTLGVLIAWVHHVYWRPKTSMFFIKITVGLVLLVLSFTLVLRPLMEQYDIFLFQRVEMFLEGRKNAEKEDRDVLISGGIDQFLQNPAVGDQYVMRGGNGYPHNILVEVLMATGIVGSILFLLMLGVMFLKMYRLTFTSYQPYPFMLMCMGFFFFTSGFTSGSLFVNPEIWLSVAMILALPTAGKIKNALPQMQAKALA